MTEIHEDFGNETIHQSRMDAQKKYLEANKESIAEKRIVTQKSVQNLSIALSNLHLLGYKEAVFALIKYKNAAEKFWLETTKSESGISKDAYLQLKDSIRDSHIEL